MNNQHPTNKDALVEARVQNLLSRMTLREKAAQTCMCRGVEYATKPAAQHGCSVAADTDFDEEKLAAEFGDAGIGFVHDVYSVPAALNKLQKFFVERSRLGIPVIFTGEALHGIAGLRGTVFPAPSTGGPPLIPRWSSRSAKGSPPRLDRLVSTRFSPPIWT